MGWSSLRNMHPSYKILTFGLMFSVLPFLIVTPWSHLLALFTLVILAIMLRLRKEQLRMIYPALAIVVITVISWLAVDIGGKVIAEISVAGHSWKIKDLNLFYASRMAMRTLIWIAAYVILLCTTSQRDLAVGLQQLRVPRAAALAFAMTLKFWDQVRKDTEMVVEAQKSRGVDFEHGPRWRRLRARFLATLVPIFFVMLKRSRTMSYALALRGFGGGRKATAYYWPSPMTRDKQLAALLLWLGLAIVAFDILLRLPGPWR